MFRSSIGSSQFVCGFVIKSFNLDKRGDIGRKTLPRSEGGPSEFPEMKQKTSPWGSHRF